jgi:PAS domain S-box-containing protein
VNEPLKILLIEDNRGDAGLIREMLAEGIENALTLEWVRLLSDGLAHLDAVGVDVVLLDLGLPDSQGLDTFSSLQSQFDRVPVVVLTGMADESVGMEAVRQGAQDYLLKSEIDSRLLARALRYAVERKRIEVALRESEQRYRLLAENASDVIWIVDLQFHPTYVSPSIERLRGYTPEEVLAQPFEETLTPASLGIARKVFAEGLAREAHSLRDSDSGREVELEYTCKDGSTVWAESRVVFLRDPSGRPQAIMGVTRDISERKAAEEQLLAALREKEALLREIHHRVKNNLQIVSSLLFLQDETDAAHAVEPLEDSRHRIRSMALIHEMLYGSQELSRVDFGEYVPRLVAYLLRSYQAPMGRIALRTEVQDVILAIDVATPCALIINELVSNCIKHAFPGRQRGEIVIRFRSEQDRFVLTVKDDGVGMPHDLTPDVAESLGLKLVSMLVDQLDGSIELHRNRGTSFRIEFQEPDYWRRV